MNNKEEKENLNMYSKDDLHKLVNKDLENFMKKKNKNS